jgi:hypothetical protein
MDWQDFGHEGCRQSQNALLPPIVNDFSLLSSFSQESKR